MSLHITPRNPTQHCNISMSTVLPVPGAGSQYHRGVAGAEECAAHSNSTAWPCCHVAGRGRWTWRTPTARRGRATWRAVGDAGLACTLRTPRARRHHVPERAARTTPTQLRRGGGGGGLSLYCALLYDWSQSRHVSVWPVVESDEPPSIGPVSNPLCRIYGGSYLNRPPLREIQGVPKLAPRPCLRL